MFTAKVGQMDYRTNLKQVKKYEIEDKDKYEVCLPGWKNDVQSAVVMRITFFIFRSFFSQEKPEWAAQKEKSVVSEKSDA